MERGYTPLPKNQRALRLGKHRAFSYISLFQNGLSSPLLPALEEKDSSSSVIRGLRYCLSPKQRTTNHQYQKFKNLIMDWSFVNKTWDKWASVSVGSSGEPLKAALLINYDPTGPSRLLSTINMKQYGSRLVNAMHRDMINHTLVLKSKLGSKSLRDFCSMLTKTDTRAEKEGINVNPVELTQFVDFVKHDKLQTQTFFIGSNQYMVTSIHENWFCARCMNTLKPVGEGAIVMQTKAFLLVAMYDGSIGSASRAMLSVDQLAWQLGRRNL